MSTLTRPATLTDELLDRITARVVSTGGGVWKLTEVYTGEVITDPAAVEPGGHRDRVRPAREAQQEWSQWPVRSGSRCSRSSTSSCSSTTPRSST